MIFCGDFNSVPECGVYQLYTTGDVSENHIDFHSSEFIFLSWQLNCLYFFVDTQEAVRGVHLKQKLPLKSACGTPKFTNFTHGFQACLDYIFYHEKNLQVVQFVPLPTLEELTENTALPSVVFPSDHISLVADLRFR